VTVKIKGVERDIKVEKTSTVPNHQTDPKWEQTFVFKLTAYELAILVIRIDVSDSVGKSRVAYYTIPVRCIRQGYRRLPLKRDGAYLPICDLLCFFQLRNAT